MYDVISRIRSNNAKLLCAKCQFWFRHCIYTFSKRRASTQYHRVTEKISQNKSVRYTLLIFRNLENLKKKRTEQKVMFYSFSYKTLHPNNYTKWLNRKKKFYAESSHPTKLSLPGSSNISNNKWIPLKMFQGRFHPTHYYNTTNLCSNTMSLIFCPVIPYSTGL